MSDDKSFIKIYGRIEDIEPTGGEFQNNEVRVTVLDWMDSLAKFKMEGFALYTDKRAEEGIQLIISPMTNPPLSTDYAVGEDTFPMIFNTVREGTKGMSEATKLVYSEMGWLYLRKDKATGEKLVFQSRTTRDGLARALISVAKEESDYLATEGGNYIMTEGGDYIILNQTDTFGFDDTMISAETKYGANVVNDLSMIAYPARIDTSLQVLYETSTRIALAAGETKSNFKVSYKDPAGGQVKVNSDPSTMVSPVATTE